MNRENAFTPASNNKWKLSTHSGTKAISLMYKVGNLIRSCAAHHAMYSVHGDGTSAYGVPSCGFKKHNCTMSMLYFSIFSQIMSRSSFVSPRPKMMVIKVFNFPLVHHFKVTRECVQGFTRTYFVVQSFVKTLNGAHPCNVGCQLLYFGLQEGP